MGMNSSPGVLAGRHGRHMLKQRPQGKPPMPVVGMCMRMGTALLVGTYRTYIASAPSCTLHTPTRAASAS